jgi:hypothetical protein
MEGAGLITVVVLLVVGLIAIPIQLLCGSGRAWRRWRAVAVVQRNHTRAGVAAFVLVALAIYTVKSGGFSSMVELYCVAGLAAFAGLWLVVGITGSQGARFDPMSVFWYGVVCLGALALLVKGVPFRWPL